MLHGIWVRVFPSEGVDAIGTESERQSLTECSSKHNRGVNEVFYEAARVSLSTKAKGSGYGNGGCVVM